MTLSFKIVAFAALAAGLAGPGIAVAQHRPVPARPVTAGGDDSLDLCGSTSRVRAGRTAIVRAAPHSRARIVDRLRGGTILHICDTGPGADGSLNGYIGYLYGDAPGCRLPGHSGRIIRIPATCRSGWIRDDDNVEQVAG